MFNIENWGSTWMQSSFHYPDSHSSISMNPEFFLFAYLCILYLPNVDKFFKILIYMNWFVKQFYFTECLLCAYASISLPTGTFLLVLVYIIHGETEDSDQEPQGHMLVLLDLGFLPWTFPRRRIPTWPVRAVLPRHLQDWGLPRMSIVKG